jgi:hypothetical protein
MYIYSKPFGKDIVFKQIKALSRKKSVFDIRYRSNFWQVIYIIKRRSNVKIVTVEWKYLMKMWRSCIRCIPCNSTCKESTMSRVIDISLSPPKIIHNLFMYWGTCMRFSAYKTSIFCASSTLKFAPAALLWHYVISCWKKWSKSTFLFSGLLWLFINVRTSVWQHLKTTYQVFAVKFNLNFSTKVTFVKLPQFIKKLRMIFKLMSMTNCTCTCMYSVFRVCFWEFVKYWDSFKRSLIRVFGRGFDLILARSTREGFDISTETRSWVFQF